MQESVARIGPGTAPGALAGMLVAATAARLGSAEEPEIDRRASASEEGCCQRRADHQDRRHGCYDSNDPALPGAVHEASV